MDSRRSGSSSSDARRPRDTACEFIHGEVTAARTDGAAIEVDTANGTIRTRRLLVATGLDDDLPNIPGLREQWGRGVVVCPYCDGWEHRDDVIGVVATSPHSVEQAQLLRQWSDRIVYFANALGEPAAEEMEALVRRGIRFESGSVTGLRIDDDRVTGVEVDGRVVPVGVVFTGPTPRPRDALLRSLGAAIDRRPARTLGRHRRRRAHLRSRSVGGRERRERACQRLGLHWVSARSWPAP